ncbi:MAG: helix-turn-helix transcriptional regulator, partial [Micromonosporaceae bacterium]|nr:helix-turn-helix transcriptional regulator [Micromonosporaceae bacterium]
MDGDRASDTGAAEASQSGRPTRRRAETRRRLLAAAFESFAERGFYGSTVEDICERAGFTRGAFYSNFSTKEELFYDLYSERTGRLINILEVMINSGDAVTAVARKQESGQEGADIFAEAIELFLSVQPDDRQWYLINTEFTLYAVRNPEAAAALAARRRQVRARIAELLTRGLTEVGRTLTCDLEVFTRAVFALHEGSLEQSYLEHDEVPVGHLERQLLPVLLAALS